MDLGNKHKSLEDHGIPWIEEELEETRIDNHTRLDSGSSKELTQGLDQSSQELR